MRRIFEETVVSMLNNNAGTDSFYAQLLSNVKSTVSYNIKTLGVYFKDGYYYMDFNPEFFNELTYKERVAVIKHEMLHILYKHLSIRGDYKNHKIANIAMDIAINQDIKNLPDMALFPINYNLKNGYNTEYYYDKLIIQNETKPIEDETVDDHQKWEVSEVDKEIMEDITQDIIEDSINKCMGNLPGQLSAILELYKGRHQVNWKQELRRIIGNKKSSSELTIKKRDRRLNKYNWIKGKKNTYTFDLVCLVDTSGSMNDDEILKPLLEVIKISQLTSTNITTIQVDTNVSSVIEINKDTKSFHRHGYGGTFMYSGIRYLYENNIKFDAIVFISDLFIENINEWEVVPKQPIFWLTQTEPLSGIDISDYKQMKRFQII